MNKHPMYVLILLLWTSISQGAEVRVEKSAEELDRTQYLSENELEWTRQHKILRGNGAAEYDFQIPQTGWYELWIEASGWPTDLLVDGKWLTHTSFPTPIWPKQGQASKVMNLYLKRGKHTLGLSRLYHPGLPYMRRFYLMKTDDPASQVRLWPLDNRRIFRIGEQWSVKLQAGRQPTGRKLSLVARDHAGKATRSISIEVPAGAGFFEKQIEWHCDAAGVFDLSIEQDGRIIDRVIQFVVMDTAPRPIADGEWKRELIAEIDCSRKEPDYASGETRVVSPPIGAYRETGPRGKFEFGQKADWFAYTLPILEIQKPYLVELVYPDNDYRTFTVSVFENAICPYPIDAGVASGGEYELSGQMQTKKLVIWPRQNDPRLVVLNWSDSSRAAAARIRLYRIEGSLPALRLPPKVRERNGRQFGYYFEEPLRFTTYFGARPGDKEWPKFIEAAERWAEWSQFVGANLWIQTSAIYQCAGWPSQFLPGYVPMAEDYYGAPGPPSPKDPESKDILRLLMFIGESQGISVVPELYMGANHVLYRYLDKRFGGKGTVEDDSPAKQWLIVSRDGKAGAQSSYLPRYNPVHPAVQKWAADILDEVAERYKDSPAFAGVSIRLMSWCFISWQAFPSINWGYGDYTIERFERETGIQVPVDPQSKERFRQRFEWLMANAYDQWIQWRCRKVAECWRRWRDVLRRHRDDLALYIDMFGPHYAPQDYVGKADDKARDWHQKGWLGLARECGIDSRMLSDEPGIVLLNHSFAYPAGRTAFGPGAELKAASARDQSLDPSLVSATAQSRGLAIGFGNQYFEADLPLPLLDLKRTFGGGPRPDLARICGVVNPPGRYFLERYAHALANGNVTLMVDGSLGYFLGEPELLREFMAEYRPLPEPPFTQTLGYTDPVACWQARNEGRVYFYVVNRIPDVVTAEIQIKDASGLKSLKSGSPVTARNSALKLEMPGFALRSFVMDGGEISGIKCRVSQERRTTLKRQIDQAEQLLKLKSGGEPIILALSPMEFREAARLIAGAREAFKNGWLWKARRLLEDARVERVYQAFQRWPDGLRARMAPPQPKGAMDARELEKAARSTVRIVPASTVVPGWADCELLTWSEPEVRFLVKAPYTSRYHLRIGGVCGGNWGNLALKIAEREIGNLDSEASGDAPRPVERCFLRPVSLSAGDHILTATRIGGSKSALSFLKLETLWRDIEANRWRVIGPFESKPQWRKPGTGFDKVYAPEQERKFDATYTGRGGQKVHWQIPNFAGDYVDFDRLYHVSTDGVCYARTTIISQEDREAAIQCGVDYWAKIWLNGQLILNFNEHNKAPRKAELTFPVNLQKGRNELFLKINSGSAGNGFWLAVTDPGELKIEP